MHGRRPGLGHILGPLTIALTLFIGYQTWLKPKAYQPLVPITPPVETPATSVEPPPAPISAKPPDQPLAREGGHVRVLEPGEVPASKYANQLLTIRDSIEKGNDEEAQAKLLALPQEMIGDQRVRPYAAVLWNNLGVLKEKSRGTEAAVTAFKTAVSLDPKNPTSNLNLAHAYWELRDPGLTPEFLEKVMGLVPDNPFPHLALADLLYEKDDLAGAALHLDQATERVQQDPSLHSYLKAVTAKVKRTEQTERNFATRESSHFTVKFDGGEDYATWSRVLEILEDAYRDIGQRFGYFPSKPIMVVLHTRDTFQSATGSPAWADALYDPTLGRIQIPTQGALTDEKWLARVLRHEFVHALLHERMGVQAGRLPTWLNEGLAMQLAGDPWPDIDQFVRGDVRLIPLNLLEGGWGGLSTEAATVAYLEGNSATLYLIDRFGMNKVGEILGHLKAGQSIAAAMQDKLFMPYDQFQRQWVENLNEKLRARRT
ncbi:MAG TPA: tetratricopeptide repeat protein [Nitrospiraceae bacterium]|nr:tetratricopeptide repeat protein [Nitrospiraceae bacterium]